MLGLSAAVRVYLATAPADMRKGFDGLAALASGALGLDPLSGHLIVFSNRRRDRIKILYWDRDGFAVWAKKQDSVCPHSFVFTEIGGLAQNLSCRPAAVGGMD